MRIISLQQGADLKAAFTRLKGALDHIHSRIEFAFDEIRGFHTTCPTNLGRAMRASVHMRIPLLSQQPEFEDICDDLGLSIRGIHGEHSDSADGIHEISNKRRLGITKRGIYQTRYEGVEKLMELESILMEEPCARLRGFP